jgi:hypothetical protein
MQEEIEIYREQEKQFNLAKKQNTQLKERMQDYQLLDATCKE